MIAKRQPHVSDPRQPLGFFLFLDHSAQPWFYAPVFFDPGVTMIVALLVLILLAVIFPKMMRFIGSMVLLVLFAVMMHIGAAKAENPSPSRKLSAIVGVYYGAKLGDSYFSVLPLTNDNSAYTASLVIIPTKGCSRILTGMLSSPVDGSKTTIPHALQFFHIDNANNRSCVIDAVFNASFTGVELRSDQCDSNQFYQECNLSSAITLAK